MADFVIKAENLGKSYIIGHEKQERYTALRDVLSNKVRQISSKTRQIFKGGQLITGNELEEFWALKNINFEIKQGDRVGIIGRNGAGKSTLLKVLSRITEPTTGKVHLKGRVASLLEVGTGFHPELSGRENIYLNGAILGMSRVEIRKKFDAIVDFSGVEKFLDTPVKKYSSGMYVRLAFAVAAHLEPEILIIDEVLAVGDTEFQKKCLGKMEDVSTKEGRTVLFVSHNMGMIAKLCNVGILLNQGNILAQGSVKNIVEKYLSSNQSSENKYIATEKEIKNKCNYFKKIIVLNNKNEATSSFAFDEKIKLNFEFTISEIHHNAQIGISLQDKFQNRVFTILKPLTSFKNIKGTDYSGTLELPSSLIAPNSYSFVFALWTKDGIVFDLIESVCPIRILDNGTDLSLYEGVDYGNIIITPNWIND
jgi:lipopolysaccharide transport system ATP-binding protein